MDNIENEKSFRKKIVDHSSKHGLVYCCQGFILFGLLGLILNPPHNALVKCCVSAFAVLLYNELIIVIIVYAFFRAVVAIHTVVKSVLLQLYIVHLYVQEEPYEP